MAWTIDQLDVGHGAVVMRPRSRPRADAGEHGDHDADQRPVADYRSLRAMWGWQWWQPFLLLFIYKYHKWNDYIKWLPPLPPHFLLLAEILEVQMGRGGRSCHLNDCSLFARRQECGLPVAPLAAMS